MMCAPRRCNADEARRARSIAVPAACTPFCLIAVFLIAVVASGSTRAAEDEAKPGAGKLPEFKHAVLIRFEGPITPMLEQYVYRKLDEAKQQGADLVVLEIESPGGFLDESLRIAKRLRDIQWARTVAFVPNRAYSGAAIVALGCDEIVLAPRAMFGDAGPIIMGEDSAFRHAPEKIVSALTPELRSLAEAKGRPGALAEAMADLDLVVYEVKNTKTGDVDYMSQADIDGTDNPADWEKVRPVPESRDGRFLTVTGDRAVALGLGEGNAKSREELRRRYKLTDEFVVLEPSGVDTAVYVLNLPLVTGLLFVVGLIALYVEFSAPGISIGGLIAGLCFALFFWSRFLGGTAGWLEVVLFAAGVVFLMVELFVLPGFGISGISGMLLILASLVMAGLPGMPRAPAEWSTLATSLLVLLGAGFTSLIGAFMLSKYLGAIPVLNRLQLQPPGQDEITTAALGAPAEGVHHTGVRIGDIGRAESPLRPAGIVRFGDEYVDVVTEGTLVDKGSPVRVIQIRGNRVVVRVMEELA